MKRILSVLLASALAASVAVVPVSAEETEAKSTETTSYNYVYDAAKGYSEETLQTREMEKLGRGLVAIKTTNGVYLSWRLFGSEDTVYGSAEENVSFDIYRDGEKIATERNKTNYLDAEGKADSTYYVLKEGETADVMDMGVSFIGSTITVNSPKAGLSVYAVKYGDDGNILEKVIKKEIKSIGAYSFDAGFEPDKVFFWDGMEPVPEETVGVVKPYANSYFDIPLKKPAAETIKTPSGETVGTFNFSPTDCSTGDLDGDGEYEIVVKWVSSEHDVGSPGSGNGSYSGTVRYAAYKLDGTKLWDKDINLGRNIYSSAHTAQFLVYDFDGDGKSEMMVQTSVGSTDGNGEYVSKAAKTETSIAEISDETNATTDYRPSSGWGIITTGKEFLTVFDGETGAALDTISLPTARVGDGSSFGDTSGNRSNRFVANVAYLDGVKPYAVYLRGYYFGRNGQQRTSIAGISFDGEKLSPDYRFDTKSGQPGYYDGAGIYVGNGNHNCTVADVDNDGKDEFITGALCMEVKDDNTFKPRWCTFMEHGDALHIGDYDPTIQGLEFFTVHEDSGPNTMSGQPVEINYGMSVINADTGDIIRHWTAGGDTGRGVMANIGAGGFYQVTSAAGTYRSDGGSNFTAGNYGMSTNFRIFWDGDLYDELLDGTDVTDWNGNGMGRIFRASGCTKINGTKSNPGLQADILGDWREELVYPTTDGNKLRVFMTTTPTDYKIKTLMHDPVYRSGVAAEQTCYNQPPHVGFYMGEEVFEPSPTSLKITQEPSKTTYAVGEDLNLGGMKVSAVYEDGTEKEINYYAVSGYDANTAGEQKITITYKGVSAELTVYVKNIARIEITSEPDNKEVPQMSELDTRGLVVTAVYEDETTAVVDGYTLEYSTKELGEQTVTVNYMGKTAEFTITVTESAVSDLNGTYENSETTSKTDKRFIGTYYGSFTLEHKVTINSMPANSSNDRNNTDGFFFRFMSDAHIAGTKDAVGGGWQLVDDNGKAKVQWKSTDAQDITKTSLTIGETYTFKYDFTHVGDGEGARVSLTITDAQGKVMGSGENLNLRNLSNDAQITEPITMVEIHNQAKAGSTASVTISDAVISSAE